MVKPLISPLVLDLVILPLKSTLITPKTPESTKQYSKKTPTNGNDIAITIRSLPPSKRRDPVIRQLFAKVRKGLDARVTEIAEKDHHIRQLEHKISKCDQFDGKELMVTLITDLLRSKT